MMRGCGVFLGLVVMWPGEIWPFFFLDFFGVLMEMRIQTQRSYVSARVYDNKTDVRWLE